jgi:hypothetical protein
MHAARQGGPVHAHMGRRAWDRKRLNQTCGHPAVVKARHRGGGSSHHRRRPNAVIYRLIRHNPAPPPNAVIERSRCASMGTSHRSCGRTGEKTSRHVVVHLWLRCAQPTDVLTRRRLPRHPYAPGSVLAVPSSESAAAIRAERQHAPGQPDLPGRGNMTRIAAGQNAELAGCSSRDLAWQ